MYVVFGDRVPPSLVDDVDLTPLHTESGITILGRENGYPRAVLAPTSDGICSIYGEIYNHQEVCLQYGHSTTRNMAADIGNLVAREGMTVLGQLNGSFSMALYKQSTQTLYIASDRYGSQRFYYYFRDGSFRAFPQLTYFSHFGNKPVIDLSFLIQFLTFRYILDDHTIFEDVFLMPYGTALEVTRSGLGRRRYWDWTFEENSPVTDEGEITCEMSRRWIKAVERRVSGKQKIAIPLSGGLDSRAILGAALECKEACDIITFTGGTPGTFDYEIGRRVAKYAGIRNVSMDHTVLRDYDDEYRRQIVDSDGMINSVFRFFLSDWERISLFSSNVMVGFMGDPLAGSHLRQSMLGEGVTTAGELSRAKDVIFHQHRLVPQELVIELLDIEKEAYDLLVSALMTESIYSNPHKKLPNFCDHWDFVHRQRRFTLLCVLNLREQYSYLLPFLDNDFVDFALQISPRLRIQQKWYKTFLTTCFPKLYRLPTKNSAGRPLVAKSVGSRAFQAIGLVSHCLLRTPIAPANWLSRRLRSLSDAVAHRSFHPDPGICRSTQLNVNYADFSLWLRDNTSSWANACKGAMYRASEYGIVSKAATELLLYRHQQGDDSLLPALLLVASLGWLLDCYQPQMASAVRSGSRDPGHHLQMGQSRLIGNRYSGG